MAKQNNEESERHLLAGMTAYATTYTANGLERESSPEKLLKLSDKLKRYSDLKSIELEASLPPMACTKGCDYCCHQPVGVIGMEALDLADYIRKNFTEEEIRQLRERIANTDLDAINAKCPLLVDSSCSVYTARPFSCRAQHSFDVTPCKNFILPEPPDFRIPASPLLSRVPYAGRDGMAMALARRGIPIHLLRLGRALEIALADETIGPRYLQGENVFQSAETEGNPKFLEG